MFDWLNEGMSALTRYESVIARQLDRCHRHARGPAGAAPRARGGGRATALGR
jgi:hypothetical protein